MLATFVGMIITNDAASVEGRIQHYNKHAAMECTGCIPVSCLQYKIFRVMIREF